MRGPTCAEEGAFLTAIGHDAYMRTVAILANKGGTGKTSLTIGLASAAAHRGLSVLVVDLDPQGNATSILRSQVGKTSVADVLANPTKGVIESAIAPCDWDAYIGELDVLPSHPNVIRFDAWNGSGALGKLRRALALVQGYDVAFIDCPPSLGALTREALTAADRAVIVTTPTCFGAQGVQRAVEEITEIAGSTNPELSLAGVVINKVRSVSEEHDFRVKEMIALVGAKSVLKPSMPERIAFQQAEGTGTPVQLLGTTGSREVTVILDDYLTKILQ
jgi:cellulose biosynthesis protein BcsQ